MLDLRSWIDSSVGFRVFGWPGHLTESIDLVVDLPGANRGRDGAIVDLANVAPGASQA